MDKDLPGHVVSTWEDLVLFLGGSPDSFTGLLLVLIAKADPGNRARLTEAFPRQVAAWEEWCASAPLTRGQLEDLVTGRLDGREPQHRPGQGPPRAVAPLVRGVRGEPLAGRPPGTGR